MSTPHPFASATPAPRAFAARIADIALAAAAVVTALINRRRAAIALDGMDARMLKDIGLTPEDLRSAFAEPIWNDPTRRMAVIAVERRSAQRERAKEALDRRIAERINELKNCA